MVDASTSVTPLATTMGHCRSTSPQASHGATPSVIAAYMPSEIPLTSRVRSVSRACGRKLPVVSTAAVQPSPSCRGMGCAGGAQNAGASRSVHCTSASSAGRAAPAWSWLTMATST